MDSRLLVLVFAVAGVLGFFVSPLWFGVSAFALTLYAFNLLRWLLS